MNNEIFSEICDTGIIINIAVLIYKLGIHYIDVSKELGYVLSITLPDNKYSITSNNTNLKAI